MLTFLAGAAAGSFLTIAWQKGWRNFPDGNGGEQVCIKCGMGAMAYTLRTAP